MSQGRSIVCLIVLMSAAGCYHGARASEGINASWKGRSAKELRAHWGAPHASETAGPVTSLRYQHTRHRVESLPMARARLNIGPEGLDAYGEMRAGTISENHTHVTALVDGNNRILSISGPSLRWGPSDDANLRWGLILGMHAGMGTLDDTETPLPSGGMYIGGMLGATLGLVGNYSLAAGSDEAGSAMAMAWSMGPQWWPHTRISLRAGPAMILAFDPGFDNGGLEAGVHTSASYAVIRSGGFVLDLRADLNAGTSTRFGSLGIGFNLN